MFERFTDRARRVVVLAQEESRRLDHDYIGTEHLLLGLLAVASGPAYEALTAEGIELAPARAKVEELVGRGESTPSGHIPFTPRAKKVLELSLREALGLGHNYIGTEHVLLGLIREGEGVACQVIVTLGADLRALDGRVRALVGAMMPPEVRASRSRRLWSSITRSGRVSGEPGPAVQVPPGEGLPVLRRLTAGAWRAVLLAQSEALRYGQAAAGEEHLLLGIIAEGEGRGARALNAVGVTLEAAHEKADALLGQPRVTEPTGVLEPTFAASGLEVTEMALVEAVSGGRHGIDTDDLLLGFVRRAEQGEGLAAQALGVLGTSADAVRQAVADLRED
ncbi:MAG TPA: Clp protease N-terminal domain-containing protein [Acidimicrobiales bacterium]|jgi:ATP-dependent Clp protease ATP-binding subunit ClpA